MTIDLLALIGRHTELKRKSSRCGGEYAGPCPLCRRGTDRFVVWPALGRWACLGRKAGRNGCDRGGDAIQYLIERDHLTYKEACERLNLNAKRGELNAKTQRGKDAKKRRREEGRRVRG